MKDKYNLNRFIEAQDTIFKNSKTIFEKAREELQNGKKESHWMWFIFPQIAGLGSSKQSIFYSIKSINEVNEYMQNRTLYKRMLLCCNDILKLDNLTAKDIFSDDSLKLHSSITLFKVSSPHVKEFDLVLRKYFDNILDSRTIKIMKLKKKSDQKLY